MVEELKRNSISNNDFSTKSSNKNDVHDSSLLDSGFTARIVNHKKVSTFMESFIVYTIETSGDFRPFSVERRYNDFQWLFQRLIEQYPMAIIPPLPDKHNITTIERFSGIFIDQRRNALDKFIQRLTKHHILGLDKDYWSFLTCHPVTFNEYKRERPVLGKVETLWQSIQNFSTTGVGGSVIVGSLNSNLLDNSGLERLAQDSAKTGNIMESLSRVVKRTVELWTNIGKLNQESGCQGIDEKWSVLPIVGEQCKQTGDSFQLQVEPWIVESALYQIQLHQVARRRNDAELN